MWCLFVIILYSSFQLTFAADDTPEIRVEVFRDRMDGGVLKCKNPTASLVEVNAEFQIYLQIEEIIYRSKCRKFMDVTEYPVDFTIRKDQNNGYVFKNLQLDQVGVWKFSCLFHTKNCLSHNTTVCWYTSKGHKYQDNGVKCDFDVKVVILKELPPALGGYLNNKYNKYAWTKPRSYTYEFYDGEPTSFVCDKTNGTFIQLSLSKEGVNDSTGLLKTKRVTLYVKLIAAYERAVLKCTITDETQQHRFEITLRFTMYKRSKDVLGFVVNGLTLPSYVSVEEGHTVYKNEYTYYPAEPLRIKVLKDTDTYGNANCNANGKNSVPETLNTFFNVNHNPLQEYFDLVLYEGQSPVSLTCSVLYLKDTKQKYQLIIKFIVHRPTFTPRVFGLSMANILMMYRRTTAHNVIEYATSGNEKLALICECDFYVPCIREQFDTHYNNQLILEPKINVTEAILKCEPKSPAVGSSVTFIKLIRNETTTHQPAIEVTISTKITIKPSTKGNTMTTTVTLDPPQGKNQIPTKSDITIYVVVGVVALIILIAVILVIYMLKKKQRKRMNQITDTDYQNLRQHQGSMRTRMPEQQDSNIVAVPNLEGLYAKPLPKSERNKHTVQNKEPTYAEVHKNTDPTYTEVHKNTDPTYTEVHKNTDPTYTEVHKNTDPTYTEVHKNTDPTYTEVHKNTDPTYAAVEKSRYQDLDLTNDQQLNYTEVLPTSRRSQIRLSSNTATYAQILKTNDGYANAKDLKKEYANIFTNSNYANLAKTERAEPAYCEVGANSHKK